MKTIIATLLLSTIAVSAQEMRKHKDVSFHAADYVGYGLVAGACVGDYLTTREGLDMRPAMIEHTLPSYVVQSPGRLAAYEFGTVLVIDGTAALFTHTGHPVIGRTIAYGAAAWGFGTIFRNRHAIDEQLANQSKLVKR